MTNSWLHFNIFADMDPLLSMLLQYFVCSQKKKGTKIDYCVNYILSDVEKWIKKNYLAFIILIDPEK